MEINEELAIKYLEVFNQAIDGKNLMPLQIADVMHAGIGTILATYITNYVEKGLREYVAAKMLYSLTGNIMKHIETLEVAESAQQPIDDKVTE